MYFDLRSILPVPSPSIHLVDVGAMTTDDKPMYGSMLDWPEVTLSGFEPNQLECAKLNARARTNSRFWPMALGDGRKRTFYQCSHPMTSSLYEPNHLVTDPFQCLSEYMQVIGREEIATTRLDDVPDLAPVHFQKLDVQGAELEILAGGLRQLESTAVVQIEVEFVPLYKDQPLFGDIDQFLRSHGFQFHRFHAIHGRAVKPFSPNNDRYSPMSQWLWSDAIYYRDLTTLPALSEEMLIRLALLLHEIYRSFDIVSHILEELGRRGHGDLKQIYIERFQQLGARSN